MANYTKAQIIKSNAHLYADIDNLIDDLLEARKKHDVEAEGKVLFAMEGAMVQAQQQLACINEWLNSTEE